VKHTQQQEAQGVCRHITHAAAHAACRLCGPAAGMHPAFAMDEPLSTAHLPPAAAAHAVHMAHAAHAREAGAAGEAPAAAAHAAAAHAAKQVLHPAAAAAAAKLAAKELQTEQPHPHGDM
jgi:hypothetical protein